MSVREFESEWSMKDESSSLVPKAEHKSWMSIRSSVKASANFSSIIASLGPRQPSFFIIFFIIYANILVVSVGSSKVDPLTISSSTFMYSGSGTVPVNLRSKNFIQNLTKCDFSILPASNMQYSSRKVYQLTTEFWFSISRPWATRILSLIWGKHPAKNEQYLTK